MIPSIHMVKGEDWYVVACTPPSPHIPKIPTPLGLENAIFIINKIKAFPLSSLGVSGCLLHLPSPKFDFILQLRILLMQERSLRL